MMKKNIKLLVTPKKMMNLVILLKNYAKFVQKKLKIIGYSEFDNFDNAVLKIPVFLVRHSLSYLLCNNTNNKVVYNEQILFLSFLQQIWFFSLL